MDGKEGKKTLTGAEGRAGAKEESKGGGKAERIQGPCEGHFAGVV